MSEGRNRGSSTSGKQRASGIVRLVNLDLSFAIGQLLGHDLFKQSIDFFNVGLDVNRILLDLIDIVLQSAQDGVGRGDARL